MTNQPHRTNHIKRLSIHFSCIHYGCRRSMIGKQNYSSCMTPPFNNTKLGRYLSLQLQLWCSSRFQFSGRKIEFPLVLLTPPKHVLAAQVNSPSRPEQFIEQGGTRSSGYKYSLHAGKSRQSPRALKGYWNVQDNWNLGRTFLIFSRRLTITLHHFRNLSPAEIKKIGKKRRAHSEVSDCGLPAASKIHSMYLQSR